MKVGLLGLSFFNRFKYDIDPVRGVVTLRENGLVEQCLIRGGRSEPQWRSEYGQVAARRRVIEARLAQTARGDGRTRRRLEAALEEVDRQLAVLDDEADAARVPFRWRDVD